MLVSYLRPEINQAPTTYVSTHSVSLIHLLPFEERAWERGYHSVNIKFLHIVEKNI